MNIADFIEELDPLGDTDGSEPLHVVIRSMTDDVFIVYEPKRVHIMPNDKGSFAAYLEIEPTGRYTTFDTLPEQPEKPS